MTPLASPTAVAVLRAVGVRSTLLVSRVIDSSTALYCLLGLFLAGALAGRRCYRHLPGPALQAHVLLAALEPVLFMLGHGPNSMALGLASLHSVTGLMLVRKLRRGQPLLVRPLYQAGAVGRLAVMFAAWLRQDQTLHHDAVTLLVMPFFWARFSFPLFALAVSPGKSYASALYTDLPYTLCIFMAVIMPSAACRLPHAPEGLLALAWCLSSTGRWTTRALDRADQLGERGPVLARVMRSAGICELSSLRRSTVKVIVPKQVLEVPVL